MNPLGNAEMLANVDTDLLDRYECAEILDRLRPDAWASAGISADDPYGRIDPDRRSVLMQPVPLPSGHQICRKLMRAVCAANPGSEHPTTLYDDARNRLGLWQPTTRLPESSSV